MTLPQRPEDLRGLRAARWIRESSGRQLDKYGPTAQRAMQDRTIAELGLVDTGLSWKVAKSGWSGPDSMLEPPATTTPEFRAMLAAAERHEYDVLVVGYTSRFIRDLALALHYRRVFHRFGAVIYLCDDHLLTSSNEDWERLADKAKAAEISSRDQSKNVRSGYEAKRNDDRDPGGHPPFGFRRSAAKLVEPNPDTVPLVQRIVDLSAAGQPDRAVAAEVGLSLYVVRGVLTSPLYIGRLRDGSPANWAPLVELTTWNRAQVVRAERATTAGRPASPKRPYALSMLHCAACGRRLIGDTNYYRHNDACPDFRRATPDWPVTWRGRRDGKGYPRHLFEAVVGRVLEEVSLSADTLTHVIGLVASPPAAPDSLALTRIERDRDRALEQYRRDRVSATLDRTMAQLDRDEAEARRPREADGVPVDVAVRYLRELATTWRKAEGGVGRRMLAEALFEWIGAQGFREATLRLTETAIAHGFATVIPERLELTVGYGRGERT
jgi:DNA invertase Pin-like site-specific DNA recombinase